MTSSEKRGWYFHSTLRQSTSLQAVLPGTWVIPSSTKDVHQFLLFFGDHFKIIDLKEKKKQIRHQQSFFANPTNICKGPKIGGIEFDTFFISKDTELLLMCYNVEENLFCTLMVFQLNQMGIQPSFMCYGGDGILTLSCVHGSLTSFKIKERAIELIKTKKPTNCILTAFENSNGNICRVEAGEYFSIYNRETLDLISKISCKRENESLYNAFPFGEGIILCYMVDGSAYRYYYKEGDEELVEISSLNDVNCIIDSCELNEESYAILTSETIYILTKSPEFKISKLYDYSQKNSFIRIFALYTDTVFVVALGAIDSFIIVNTQRSKSDIKPIRYVSAVGILGLDVLAHSSIIPQFVSYSENGLSIMRQGQRTVPFASARLQDAVTGMFFAAVEKHSYIAVSHPNSTQIFECNSQSITQITIPFFNLTTQTLGFGSLHAKTPYLFQVRNDGILLIPQSDNPKPIPIENLNTVCLFTATYKQLLVATTKRKFRLYELSQKGDTPRLSPVDFDIQGDATAIAFSGLPHDDPDVPDTGFYARSVAIGISDGSKHSVSFYTAVPFDKVNHADTPVMATVSSIAYLSETIACVGLENGIVAIFHFVPESRQARVLNTLHLGKGAVKLVPLDPVRGLPGSQSVDRFSVLATNSRTWRITLLNNGAIVYNPVDIPSVAYAVPFLSNQPKFAAVTGRNLNAYHMDILSDSSPQAITMPPNVVKSVGIPHTNFFLVATERSVFLHDLSTGGRMPLDEAVAGEVIKDVAVTDPGNVTDKQGTSYFAILFTTNENGDDSSNLNTIRLFTATTSQSAIKVSPDVAHGQITNVVSKIAIGVKNRAEEPTVYLGGGSTIIALRFKPHSKQFLEVVARREKVGFGISVLQTVDAYLYVGDIERSVKVLRFDESSMSLVEMLSDNKCRGVTAIARSEPGTLCGGDRTGNVFVYDLPTTPTSPPILALAANINVGDVVTGTAYTTGLFSSVWYSTVRGAIGGLITAAQSSQKWARESEGRVQWLRFIEERTSAYITNVTRISPYTQRNKHFPMSCVVDMDVVELFLKLQPKRREQIVSQLQEELTKKAGGKARKVEFIEIAAAITQFKNYFTMMKSAK